MKIIENNIYRENNNMPIRKKITAEPSMFERWKIPKTVTENVANDEATKEITATFPKNRDNQHKLYTQKEKRV